MGKRLIVLLCALLLSGCVITAGEVTGVDLQGTSGNLTSRFISAEGRGERTIAISDEPATLQVIAIVAVGSGDLQIDLLNPDGEVSLSLAAEPDTQITRSGQVQLDEQGRLRYRINAREAREGSLQIFFQSE